MDTNADITFADKEFTAKNYDQAEKLYTNLIEKSNDLNCDLFLKRSECYFKLGKYQNSFDDAQILVEHKPDMTHAFYLCGRALSKMERFEEALSLYKQGLELDPKDPYLTEGLKSMQNDVVNSYEKKGGESTYNAVKMSSRDPYPGDDELEKMEKEILTKWGILEFPDIILMVPDQQKALKEFQRALQFMKAGNNSQAIEKIQVAVSLDPANFNLWGEAAKVLFEMGETKKAFRHCNIIPQELRTARFWTLGGKILAELNLPVHAEMWLRHACRLNKEDEEAPLLFQNVRVKRLYGPLTEGSKVEVRFTQFGRAVHVTEDVSAGENCFRDKAVVLAQTIDTLSVPACSYCAKCLMTAQEYFGAELLSKNTDLKKIVNRHWPKRPRIPCKTCSHVIYCSDTCRDEAWEEYHKILCVSITPAVEKLWEVCSQYSQLTASDARVWKGVWNASFSPFVLAKIWASIICLANKLAKQNGRILPSAADWTMAKSPYRKFIAYGSSSNATNIPEMVTIMQNIFETLPEGQKYSITQREFDGRYFQATCNVQAFSDPCPPFNEFMNNIVKEPKRDMVHLFTMKDPDDAMFAGMFPLHACMNHSCDNNAEVLDGHPGVLVRAKKPIKRGEELFTTYINTRMSRRERRAWLFRGYNFWCHCPRCQFEGDGPEVCAQCGKSAKEAGKEKFPGCGKCHRAWYCSTSCQKTAWKKGHKKICK